MTFGEVFSIYFGVKCGSLQGLSDEDFRANLQKIKDAPFLSGGGKGAFGGAGGSIKNRQAVKKLAPDLAAADWRNCVAAAKSPGLNGADAP